MNCQGVCPWKNDVSAQKDPHRSRMQVSHPVLDPPQCNVEGLMLHHLCSRYHHIRVDQENSPPNIEPNGAIALR